MNTYKYIRKLFARIVLEQIELERISEVTAWKLAVSINYETFFHRYRDTKAALRFLQRGKRRAIGMQDASTASSSKLPADDQGVLLSIEPVQIYSDSQANGSALSGLEREPRLKDVTAAGVNVFQDTKSSAQQLREDVHRLWAERGDFLKFSTQTLRDKVDRKRRKRMLHSTETEEPESSADDDAASTGESDTEVDLGRDKGAQGVKDGEDALPAGGTIKESEFVALRDEILSKLDIAHFSSIHTHQLLGMLIKANKTVSGHSAGLRHSSPAPSLGSGSNKSGSVPRSSQVGPSTAPLGIFANLTHASSKEEEFVLNPMALALSRTSLNTAVSARRRNDDNDESSDDEVQPSDPNYGIIQARREMESSTTYKEERLRDFKIGLTTKREALRTAADLLQAGADELRSCHGSERERWRGLIGLRNRGWGFTPGRPLLDMERFGSSSTTNANDEEDLSVTQQKVSEQENKPLSRRQATVPKSLHGFGTPLLASDGKIRDEGARDAWIGFGLPEAPVELRRRTLAYWADTTASPEDSGKIVFPDRPRRRLCVEFVLWPKTQGVDKTVWTSDRDTTISDEDNEDASALGLNLDEDLQQASKEASDELIFGDIVSQARQLSPAFGVQLTATTVRIILTAQLDLLVQLVPTEAAENSSDKQKSQHSSFASLILAFLRSSPMRKWNAFSRATHDARTGDINAKALAARNSAAFAPKRVSSVSNDAMPAGLDASKGSSNSAKGSGVPDGDSLGPILVALHYTSFAMQLNGLLRALEEQVNEQKDRKCHLEWAPLTMSRAGAFMSTLVEASQYTSSTDEREDIDRQFATASGLDALAGHAKVWVDDNLICTLNFAQPSELTARFQPSAQNRAGLVTPGIGAGRPLQVDLATLDDLLRRQISQSL